MSTRIEIIQLELDEYKKSGSNATYSINFRGKKKYLPVITVDPRILLLNNKNNRLSGQLADHPKRDIVESDLKATESQKIIAELLSKTEKFKELKEQLKELKQQHPGLITRDGLIVNGNTRVAALRELGISHVDVAVLPDNVLDADVLQIEMQLQVQELVHQDYSFTNELLLMQRFLDAGGTKQEYAKRKSWMRGWERKVKQQMRLLEYIEEVRRLTNPPIPYAIFDNKQQHLKDLDNDYIALRDEGDVEAANDLKWTRLSMIFIGLNKDQVRAIDVGFVEDEVLPRLRANHESQSVKFLEKFIIDLEEDGLDDLIDNDVYESNIDMQSFLKSFLSDDKQRNESGEIATELEGVYQAISWNSRRASEKIIDDMKLESAKAEPSEVLKDMRVRVASLRDKLPELINTKGFKQGKFEYDLRQLKVEIEKIERLLDVSD